MRKRKAESRSDQASRLFEAVVHRAKLAGDFDSAEPILDYCRPCILATRGEPKMELNTSEFDFLPCLTFGSDGNLYLNCYLTRFNGVGYNSVRIGTLRTLNTDMDTCKIMGELCGALTFHARQHLDEQQRHRVASLTAIYIDIPQFLALTQEAANGSLHKRMLQYKKERKSDALFEHLGGTSAKRLA